MGQKIQSIPTLLSNLSFFRYFCHLLWSAYIEWSLLLKVFAPFWGTWFAFAKGTVAYNKTFGSHITTDRCRIFNAQPPISFVPEPCNYRDMCHYYIVGYAVMNKILVWVAQIICIYISAHSKRSVPYVLNSFGNISIGGFTIIIEF